MNKDRIDFIQSITESSGRVDIMGVAFEQMMSVYNFIENHKKVEASLGTDNVIKFDIEFETPKEANELYEATNGVSLNVYDEQFTMQSESNDQIVSLKMIHK